MARADSGKEKLGRGRSCPIPHYALLPDVRPDVKGFLDFLAMAGGPTMSEMGAEGARLSYLQMSAVAEMEPRALAVIKDLTCPGPAGEIPLRFYDARETREPGPAVMFFHRRRLRDRRSRQPPRALHRDRCRASICQ